MNRSEWRWVAPSRWMVGTALLLGLTGMAFAGGTGKRDLKREAAASGSAAARGIPSPQVVRPVPHASGGGTPLLQFVPAQLNALTGQTYEYDEGDQAINEQLGEPVGVAVDAAGNIYIADYGNSTVRRIDAQTGVMTTIAGQAPSDEEEEVRYAEARKTWASAKRATAIQRKAMTPAERTQQHFGPQVQSLKSGTRAFVTRPQAHEQATDATLEGPLDVSVDASGNVYFADSEAQVVEKIATDGTLTIVAGTQDQQGFSGDGGAATAAMLNYPTSIVLDAAGNLYIADAGNYVVRKVDTSGKISTIAGTPQQSGYSGDGGAATSAEIGYCYGLALDAAGNLYVTDDDNGVVRKVDTTGKISTIAGDGSGEYAGDGGPAIQAGIDEPDGIALDAAGDLYIAEYGSNVVRKVDTSGNISTVVGQRIYTESLEGLGGPATAAEIGNVNDVAIDPAGSVLVTLDRFDLLLRAGPTGVLNLPYVAKPANVSQTYLLTNPGNGQLTFSGTPTVTNDAFTVAPATTNGCDFAQTLAAGASCAITLSLVEGTVGTYTGTLNVADNAANSPQTIALNVVVQNPPSLTSLSLSSYEITAGQSVTATVSVTSASGTGPTPSGTVNIMNGETTVATGTLDGTGNASLTFSLSAGYYDLTAKYAGDSNYVGGVSGDQGLQVDAPVATLTLTATPATVNLGQSITATATIAGNGTVQPTGNIQFVMGGSVVAVSPLSGGTATATFGPSRLGNAGVEAVYTGDQNYASALSNTVPITAHGGLVQFNPGQAIDFAGVPEDDNHWSFSGNGGPASAARFHFPSDIAVDSAGNVYISDESNDQIRRVDAATGVITAYAGVQHQQSIYSCDASGDGGDASNAYFCNPAGLAFDKNGNLYVADYSNGAIRRIDHQTHIITTVAGVLGDRGDDGDGLATTHHLDSPEAIAFDATGNLYITDYSAVRKVDTSGQMTTIAGYYFERGNTVPGSTANATYLQEPTGVAVDANGLVYIADDLQGEIYYIDANGKIQLYAGSGGGSTTNAGDGGPATSAFLRYPQRISFDASNNLYIADYGNELIRRVDPAGIITSVAGSYGGGYGYYLDPQGEPATNIPLIGPNDVVPDGTGGLYVVNSAVQNVLKVGPAGSMLFPQITPGTSSAAQILTVSNTGDQPFTFGSPAYTVTGEFTVSAASNNSCPTSGGTLVAGASCYLQVQYAPTDSNLANGSISFSDSALASPQTVKLIVNTNPLPSTTAVTVYGSPANPGAEIDILAEVSGNGPGATGTISFYDGSTPIGTGQLGTPLAGYASLAITTLSPGDHSITAVYGGDENYSGSTSPAVTATVQGQQQSQTITLGALPTPGYADNSFSVAATASSGLPVTITVVSGPAAGSGSFTITGAGTVMLQATQAGDGTYAAATPVNFSVVVAPAILMVTANNAARSFDQPNPAFGYMLSGFAHGDTSSVVSGAPVLSTTAIGTSNAGAYPITAGVGNLAAANYTFALVNGTLTVNGGVAQTILFARMPNLPVNTTMTLTARATSGLPVSYSVSGPATLAGNRVTPTGPGQVTVTATQPGNGNYAAATPVSQSFTAQ